jgi:hypothetical protein
MPDFSVEDLDISPDEFVYACNKREIKELIDALVEENHISKNDVITGKTERSRANSSDIIFDNNLDAISRNRLHLTIEEEEMINKLAERFKFL